MLMVTVPEPMPAAPPSGPATDPGASPTATVTVPHGTDLPHLPETGAGTTVAFGIGLALVAVGFIALWMLRRRSERVR